MINTLTINPEINVPDEFRKLLGAVDKDNPSKSDIREVQKWLEERPELGLSVANLVNFPKGMLLQFGPLKVKSVELCLEAGLDVLQDNLGYQEAQPLERMLIENISLCWLRLYLAEIEMTKHTCGSHSLSEGRYWDQRLSTAQMRYLRAIETLARVRKANIAIQVNIAKQQINTSG